MSSPTADLRTQLNGFFERYAQTFHEQMGTFCGLYVYPCSTVRLDGSVQVLLTQPEAVQFFSEARLKYEAEGCVRWDIHHFDVVPLGTHSAAATLEWQMLRADGSRIRSWRQTYNVLGGAGAWKVLHSTLHRGSESS
ncbi:MAG: hypothetical protein HRU17_07850 [Polyangiaceae bacterium]|nr:hypothetical protein [Polyangiaceae bacterium]